jgi:glyoxylase-like metal-dependent hydrolase (beta-lactamase superfamily II)
MGEQIPVDPSARAESEDDGSLHEVAVDLAYQRLAIVNVVFYGAPGTASGRWVLIDAGVIGTTALIRNAAKRRYGTGSRPAAIVMTHGHFDHVGALRDLAEAWNVPVFAHEQELPYLNGSTSYPPPDPTASSGLMAKFSPLYPRGPVDVSEWLQPLPADGTVPGMPRWQWIHTPGHTIGHVSLWRDSDRTVIAGDAFITTNQESAYAVAVQRTEVHGPPMYFTPDWNSARESVRRLAALEPELAVTGHGRALAGAQMREALHTLARDFDRIAVPEHGRHTSSG